MEAVLDFGRGCQDLAIILMGSVWGRRGLSLSHLILITWLQAVRQTRNVGRREGGGGGRGDMQQITAHSNPYSSFSLSFCPLCIRRGFDKSFARGRAEQMLKVMNSVSRTSLAIIISPRGVPVLSYNDMFASQRAGPSPDNILQTDNTLPWPRKKPFRYFVLPSP